MPPSDEPKPLPVYEFHFFCGKDFHQMAPIGGDDRVRRCSECSEKVFLVESEEELNQRTAAKQCIALAESVATKLLAQLPEEYDTAKNGDMLSGECLPLHPGPRRR